MDGPSGTQQQGNKKMSKGAAKRLKAKIERKRLKDEKKRLKDNSQKPARRWDPLSATAQEFNNYLRSKKYVKGEVRAISRNNSVLDFVSVKEDVCPIPVRLASLDYPKEWFLDDHVGPLKEYITNRISHAQQFDGPNGPTVQEVLKVDGYALVLAKDDFTAEFVRGLIPMMADDGMPVKEATEEEIKEFDSTRSERCDPNILIKYRKHGWKIRQKVAERTKAQEH